jgi:hypothetical protein
MMPVQMEKFFKWLKDCGEDGSRDNFENLCLDVHFEG